MLKDLERFFTRVSTSWWFVVYFLVCLPIICFAGVGWAGRFALPVLIFVSFWPVLVVGIRRKGYWPTFGRLIFGYAVLGVVMTVITTWLPFSAALSTWYGPESMQATLGWILGRGDRSGMGAFFIRDLIELGLVMGLSLVTAGAGGIVVTGGVVDILGLNSGMFYVQSSRPLVALIFTWTPWEVVKCISFIFLSMSLSEPLASRLFGSNGNGEFRRDFLIYGIAGIALAFALKALLSGYWQNILSSVLIM